jgi:hypothetical protein
MQEDPKAATWDNEEVTSHIADLEVLVEEVGEKSDGRTQYKNLENSAEASNSQSGSSIQKPEETSNNKEIGFFMVDDKQ